MPDIENPTSEQIKAVMFNRTPVEYEGNEYARITAYIYRISERDAYGKSRTFMQAELLSNTGNSVVIVNPNKIIIKERA